MRIGFAKMPITPPVGVELGGYAGYRPCAGCHDPLWCKAVVVEQDGQHDALLAMDLLSVDESLSEAIHRALQPIGIRHTLVSAIHSHATPCGIVLGEGPLAEVNRVAETDPEGFSDYTRILICQAVSACLEAMRKLEGFQVRSAQGPAPLIGSERHTGQPAALTMTAVQVQTESGKNLLLYQIPCHPTVLGPENLLASGDFVGGIEKRLRTDMSVFLNGAAGDISTRFTRKAQTFLECDRMAEIAADAVEALIANASYAPPEPLQGIHTSIRLTPRPVNSEKNARITLEHAMARWQQAADSGAGSRELRILKSYVEGAGVALEFARTMSGIRELHLPVTLFRFAGRTFVTVPGELFSSLWKLNAVPICYTNGYYRYIADIHAYDAGYYEAMAAIVDRGQGEEFINQIAALLQTIS